MRTLNNKNRIARAVGAAENSSKGVEKMIDSSPKMPWHLRFAPGALNLKGMAATAGIGTIYGLLFAGLLFAPLMTHIAAQSSGTPTITTSTDQLQDGPISKLGKTWPRVRSNSMSQSFGKGDWLPPSRFRVYAKESHLTDPGPSMTWVLVDEHPASINDAAFAVQMRSEADLDQARIIDYPASYHNGAAGFSFADGHSEIKKWTDPRTVVPPQYGSTMSLNRPSSNNRDVLWLSERSSAPK